MTAINTLFKESKSSSSRSAPFTGSLLTKENKPTMNTIVIKIKLNFIVV